MLFLFEGTFKSFLKIKFPKEATKQWKSRFFSIYLLVDGRIRIRTNKLRIRIQEATKHTDPDPENAKNMVVFYSELFAVLVIWLPIFSAIYNYFAKMTQFRNIQEIPLILVGTQGQSHSLITTTFHPERLAIKRTMKTFLFVDKIGYIYLYYRSLFCFCFLEDRYQYKSK
jgi:hypothetical protein